MTEFQIVFHKANIVVIMEGINENMNFDIDDLKDYADIVDDRII